jgi:PAS domain S-box-containing protein
MNPNAVPSLICLFIMPSLGAFMYSQNRQSQVHKLFLFLCALVGYWAFTEFNMKQAESYETALFWLRASCCNVILSPLLVHFILVYINKWKDYDRFKAICLIYVPAIMISLIDLFTGATNGFPIKEPWGWTAGRPVYPIVLFFYFFWKSAVLAFVTKESIAYLKKAQSHERSSFLRLFFGILASVILGIASTTISRVVRPDFPEMSIIIALLFSVYLSYIIWKYNMLLVPSEAVEDTINLMGDCFILAGTHNQIVRVNRALLSLTGYAEKELINMDLARLIEDAPDGPVGREQNGKIISKETRLISKTGQFIPALLSETIVFNKAHVPIAMVIVAKDLTYWYKSQQKLGRMEKLESYELIIRCMVHDFNNLLAAISGHLSLADMSATLPESLGINIASARKAASLAANLTNRLSTYVKQDEMQPSFCILSEIIEESAQLALKGSSIRFDCIPDNDVWAVHADRYHMVQVFINLFINSRQAMRQGGKITVRCENQVSDDQSEFVKISLRDEGTGIPADVIGRIFQPFFTTKPNGSGLGLSIVKNIIQAHHGVISVESKEKRGTTFTILLPKAVGLQEEPIVNGETKRRIPPKKILVMDDDDLVRSAMSMMLSQGGHTVAQTANGSEAIETVIRAKSSGEPFDCAILDLTIVSGVGAERAIKRILEIDPNIKAILTSGYSTHPVIDAFKDHGFHGVLKKPFTMNDIQNAIYTAFERTAAN